MSDRRLPVRPDQEQLQRQAKELLRSIHAGDASAITELREHHPQPIDPAAAKLADAQLVLARAYRASSWTRLVHAVRLADANWGDDLDTVRALIAGNPALIHEHVLIRRDSNWGPPMTLAETASSASFTARGRETWRRQRGGPRFRDRPTRFA
ncbi:hypothetical protein BH18ACI5_BH18ACI5_05590 [soil metagenome]